MATDVVTESNQRFELRMMFSRLIFLNSSGKLSPHHTIMFKLPN